MIALMLSRALLGLHMVLLVAVLNAAPPPPPRFGPPSGSQPVGRWAGSIPGLPNSKLPDAPTLGNGYAGVLLGTSSEAAGASTTTVELWLNTNAMWGCSPGPIGPSALPVPALCSRVGFGGVRLAPGSGVALDNFSAEQRISSATLVTRQVSGAGSTLQTTTFMAPQQNIIVTTLNWTAVGVDPQKLSINVSAWVMAAGGEASVASGALLALRNSSAVPRDGSSGGYRRVRTAIAVAVAGGSLAHTGIGTEPSQQVAFGLLNLISGAPSSVVVALNDTLLTGNNHNPAPDAATLARTVRPSSVAAASAAYWASFWSKSSITLPTAPDVEAFWRGAQYISACMSASQHFVRQQHGLIPPSGLYGPWVSADDPGWEGDYTLDYNQEAQFYHVHSSNHGELSASYFGSILAWQKTGRWLAAGLAAQANLSCTATGVLFPCHVAPWSFQSFDQSRYHLLCFIFITNALGLRITRLIARVVLAAAMFSTAAVCTMQQWNVRGWAVHQ